MHELDSKHVQHIFALKKKENVIVCEGEFSLKVLILFIKDKPLRHSVGQLAEGLSGLTFTAQSVS